MLRHARSCDRRRGGGSVPPQGYCSAAVRHLRDAEFLHGDDRFPNADHLAGFSVECLLKAFLVDCCGARVTGRRPVTDLPEGRKSFGHLPKFWEETRHVMTSRNQACLEDLLSREPAPFAGWAVDDRYGDGTTVDPDRCAERIDAARELLGCWEAARLRGALS